MADTKPFDGPLPLHFVQLGTFLLPANQEHLDSAGGSPIAWSEVDYDFLDNVDWSDAVEVKQKIEVLKYLIADPGLQFSAQFKQVTGGFVIRNNIVPADAETSLWDENVKSVMSRKRHLKRLFQWLEDDWEGNGGGRLIFGVSEHDTNLSMRDIYMSLANPPPPTTFPESRSTKDQELFSRLADFDHIPGVKTNLRAYQVRSITRMIWLEMNPFSVVDMSYTPIKEPGRDGIYYVDTSCWHVVASPASIQLPKGGILCEQMGVGKTLISLALILATLHQPCTMPDDLDNCSMVTTANAMRTYPFTAERDLRRSVNWEGLKLKRPTLVRLCSNVLARHDHTAAQDLHTPTRESSRLSQTPFFYYTPPQEEYTRTRNATRPAPNPPVKMFLSPATLIVVPAILMVQWRAEAEQHLDAGALKLLAISAKGDMPGIGVLIKQDVILIDINKFGTEAKLGAKSVLKKARWKRLLLDEGSIANSRSNAMSFAQDLSVERRWLITGTPTRNMHQGAESEMNDIEHSTDGSDVKPRIDLLAGAARTQWSKKDRDDVVRLSRMLSGFLDADLFADMNDGLSKALATTLCKKDGPQHGAVAKVREVMEAIMIKHQPNAIAAETALPPITITTELLDLDPMQQLGYNALAALVAGNIGTIPVTQAASFLNRKSKKDFSTVIYNMHLACFWKSGLEELSESMHLSKKYLADFPNIPDETKALLEEAVQHLKLATRHHAWSEWNIRSNLSFPMDASPLPETVRAQCSDSSKANSIFLDSTSLLQLRIANKGGASIEEVVASSTMHPGTKQEPIVVDVVPTNKAKKVKKGKGAAAIAGSEKTRNPSLRPATSQSFILRGGEDNIDAQLALAQGNAANLADQPHLSRPLPEILRITSRSAKVNHVLKSILTAPADDKCYVGSALKNKFLREQNLAEFNKPEVRVCMLETNFGARGLTMTQANRMIFLSPVWNLDVQAQAIKRIHRIGQTRPTKVEILVTKGTFEKEIANRNSSSRTDEAEKLYSRSMIERPRFAYVSAEPSFFWDIRFTPQAPTQTGVSASGPPNTMQETVSHNLTPGPSTLRNAPVSRLSPDSPDISEAISVKEEDRGQVRVSKTMIPSVKAEPGVSVKREIVDHETVPADRKGKKRARIA